MSARRKTKASEDSPGRGARVLKWVGAVTAVISLPLGARQLVNWAGDAFHRRGAAAEQIALAQQQASRAAFADAWASLVGMTDVGDSHACRIHVERDRVGDMP